jgi:dTDP-4-dehydrorhamnose 3,5-epimerase
MNHSFSEKKGTWRGFHFQVHPFQETKLIRCVQGRIFDYVLDLRKESSTFLKIFNIELSKENQKMLFIPKGFAHGFLTLEDNSELIYLHDEYYKSEFEKGIRYNDPLICLDVRPMIISDRDKNHNLLSKNFKGI